jgi:hypothetical protein
MQLWWKSIRHAKINWRLLILATVVHIVILDVAWSVSSRPVNFEDFPLRVLVHLANIALLYFYSIDILAMNHPELEPYKMWIGSGDSSREYEPLSSSSRLYIFFPFTIVMTLAICMGALFFN